MVPELLHTAGLGEFAWTVYLFTFAWEVVGSRPTSATATVSTVPVRARSRRTPPGCVVMHLLGRRADGRRQRPRGFGGRAPVRGRSAEPAVLDPAVAVDVAVGEAVGPAALLAFDQKGLAVVERAHPGTAGVGTDVQVLGADGFPDAD